MSREQTLAWLAELQQEFGAMLRTPLDRSSGTLRAQTERYAPTLCEAAAPNADLRGAERLAVYNRQYWFRLFALLQREYLLTARLAGMWSFNQLAAQYLSEHPPTHYDLQRVAPGFAPFLARTLAADQRIQGVPGAALCESACIDAAISRVFLAADARPLAANALSPAELPSRRLRQAESVAFVRESWPLVTLRRSAQHQNSVDRLPLPPQLEASQHWLIMRQGHGHLYALLPALAYRLFVLLGAHAVGEALGRLEQECSDAERRTLPAQVQGWLRQGMQAGVWVEQP